MSKTVEVPSQWLEGLMKKSKDVKVYAPLAVINGGFRVEGLESLKGYIESAETLIEKSRES